VGEHGTVRARREVVVSVGPAGVISVAGGKLTTWRAIGRSVAAAALDRLGAAPPPATPMPLPGAAPVNVVGDEIAAAFPMLETPVRDHLASHYGMLALDLLAPARERPELLEPVVAGGPDINAQLLWARDREWAATAADALRRTTVGARGLEGPAAVERTRAVTQLA
jgi:glycerol-3-phosphate dehydrogenase